MKKAPRNIWGNPEARKEMDWWPDDIPFAAPKSIRGGRYVHNSDTIGHCLESYLDYMVGIIFHLRHCCVVIVNLCVLHLYYT